MKMKSSWVAILLYPEDLNWQNCLEQLKHCCLLWLERFESLSFKVTRSFKFSFYLNSIIFISPFASIVKESNPRPSVTTNYYSSFIKEIQYLTSSKAHLTHFNKKLKKNIYSKADLNKGLNIFSWVVSLNFFE